MLQLVAVRESIGKSVPLAVQEGLGTLSVGFPAVLSPISVRTEIECLRGMSAYLLKNMLINKTKININFISMQLIRYHINKLFGFFPPEAGVGYGFTVNMLAYFLSAVLNVAFYHKPLNH